MFLNIDKKDPNTLAVIDDSGERLTYGDLCDKAKSFLRHFLIGRSYLSLPRIVMGRF